MDITRGEQVEAELDAMIRRREENRIAWCAYYRCVAGALYARAEEYIVRAEKLSEVAEQGRGVGS